MITRETIDQIYSHLHIEDVVGEYVNLKKKGANLLGLCPFHDEKTPSFTVSPSKNIYKCFGCSKGGNGVDFLMELESMTYPEALRHIAKMYNIEIKETELSDEQKQTKSKREGLYIIYDFAKEYYHKQLLQTADGKNIGQTYLNQRGLSDEIRDKFSLGYASASGKGLVTEAKLQNFSESALNDSGLLNKHGNDFFYNRLMFPIHNLSGKVVAFGGRIFGSSDKGPKYINSPETEIYHKSKILYGFFQGKSAIRKKDACILVEGYMDVLSLHQHGFTNAVAASGTSLTSDHVRLIKRFTDNVTLMLDGDSAGISASLRSIKILLEGGAQVKVLALPEGKDPDDFIKTEGSDALAIALDEEQKDFLDFVVDHFQSISGDDPISRANVVKEVVVYLASITSPILRSFYNKKASALLQVEESILIAETNKIINKNIKNQRLSRFKNAEQDEELLNDIHGTVEKSNYDVSDKTLVNDGLHEGDLIRILMEFGSQEWPDSEHRISEIILAEIEDVLDLWKNQELKQILDLISSNAEEGFFPEKSYYLQHEDPTVKQTCINLTLSPYEFSHNWMEKWQLPLQNQKMPEENFLNDTMYSIKKFKLTKFDLFLKNQHQNIITLQSESASDAEIELEVAAYQKIMILRNQLAESLNTILLYKN